MSEKEFCRANPAVCVVVHFCLRSDASRGALGGGTRDGYAAAQDDRRIRLRDKLRPLDGTMEPDPTRQTHGRPGHETVRGGLARTNAGTVVHAGRSAGRPPRRHARSVDGRGFPGAVGTATGHGGHHSALGGHRQSQPSEGPPGQGPRRPEGSGRKERSRLWAEFRSTSSPSRCPRIGRLRRGRVVPRPRPPWAKRSTSSPRTSSPPATTWPSCRTSLPVWQAASRPAAFPKSPAIKRS